MMKYMNLLLADQSIEQIFGGGVTNAPYSETPIGDGFAGVFGFIINIVLVIAALVALTYLLWGAFDFISSGGNAENVGKARDKIVRALLGIFILIGVISLWFFISRNVLGIFGGSGGELEFRLPSLGDQNSQQQQPNQPNQGPFKPPVNPKGGNQDPVN